MQRGEVRDYAVLVNRPGAARHRLVVSTEAVNVDESLPTVLTLLVYPEDKGGLLSVAIGEVGWASVLAPEASLRSRLGAVVHTCTEAETAAIDSALKAAFDL